MARVRLEEDEADIFAERAAEDAKSKVPVRVFFVCVCVRRVLHIVCANA